MKLPKLNLFLIGLIFLGCTSNISQKPSLAQREEIIDTYFGVSLTDPYRYMENLKDTNVTNWMKEQSDYTQKVINSITGRQQLLEKMVEFDNRRTERVYNLKVTENDYYFYIKLTPDNETGKLYYRNGYDGAEILLLDSENYKNDTLNYTINYIYPTDDGSKIALEISPNGSENAELLIMDVATKEFYPEIIDRVWFAEVSWLPGNEKFLYLPMHTKDVHDPNRFLDLIVFTHNLGEDFKNDKPIFSSAMYPNLKVDSEEIPVVIYDKNSDKLFLKLETVERNKEIYIANGSEIDDKVINWMKLFDREDEVQNFITTKDEIFAYTSKNAPNFKITKTSIDKPDIKNAQTVIEEVSDGKIESFMITSEGLFYNLSKNGVFQELYFLSLFKKEKAVRIDLPTMAGNMDISAKGIEYPDFWVVINGWISDKIRYRYKTANNEFSKEILNTQAEYPEYENLIVEELMITSHDGVKVPLSIIYDKNLKMAGDNSVFLHGYGSYGTSINPFFNPIFLLPTTKGAILAVAHVRGGGELGENWHKEGYKTTKPNTWKDLIACTEYLIKEEYTVADKIAINGRSAGGILVGRAMTERPDLFGAVIPEVGLMNPIRSENTPSGPANTPEFGTVKDSMECMALINMDSYHNIREGVEYPATYVTAGFNDSRVVVWSPAKFAARLMAANTSDNPILLWVDFESGHGISDSKTKYFESAADIVSFALWQTGHPGFCAEF